VDRQIEGLATGDYLWQTKGVVPFLKCDKGLADEVDGCQVMKDMPTLDDLLSRAKTAGMYGTKMRSVINSANEAGIKAVVDQQFAVGKQIIGHGLVPIIEPEVNIKSDTKEECEDILKKYLLESLDALSEDQNVMLKVSLPTKVNHYKECIDHPRCIRVVALSGGYSREKANEILSQQDGMIASFSRAILEGLSYGQTAEEFDATLAATVESIYAASKSA
jgi:fructose-bisphosphate aldolase, class I